MRYRPISIPRNTDLTHQVESQVSHNRSRRTNLPLHSPRSSPRISPPQTSTSPSGHRRGYGEPFRDKERSRQFSGKKGDLKVVRLWGSRQEMGDIYGCLLADQLLNVGGSSHIPGGVAAEVAVILL